jgi:hypothetical protein
MLKLKLGQTDFEQASMLVEPFEASPDSDLGAGARAAGTAFKHLAELNGMSIQVLQRLVDADPKTFKTGEQAKTQAELSALYDNSWMMLFDGMQMATALTMAEDPTTRRMSRLRITAEERDALVQGLESIFSADSLRGGPRAGQHSLPGGAALLYMVLTDANRRPAD